MFIRFVMAAVLTLLPIVILLRFFYTRDVHREPRGVLIGTLVRGVFCVIPILVLGVILSIFWRASWGLGAMRCFCRSFSRRFQKS
ncbi:hypothetical protein IH601_07585 [Candidatus Bipolaricaulota bacterium]|nr:hypothetical protein [Candidatus Bipolaricaulota bacterium]